MRFYSPQCPIVQGMLPVSSQDPAFGICAGTGEFGQHKYRKEA